MCKEHRSRSPSSVNKSMMSFSYYIIITDFNEHGSAEFLERLERVTIVAHMVRGSGVDNPCRLGGGGGGARSMAG